MPTQTFFNLPEDKKQILINAAIKEFSRAPLYETSIANIVKEAAIPRGSFYQYFEDKEDLYFHLLQSITDTRQKNFKQNMIHFKGDIFKTFHNTLKSILQEVDNNEMKQFFRHVFLNMNYKTEKAFNQRCKDGELNGYFSTIKMHIDTMPLQINSDEELFHIFQILSTILMHHIIQKFALQLTNNEVIANYDAQIELLKKGCIKPV